MLYALLLIVFNSGGHTCADYNETAYSLVNEATSPITEEKCHEIFNRIKSAKGLTAEQKPQLVIRRSLTNGNLAMAMTDHATGIIQLERRMIHMVNQKLGHQNIDGLAFILAHELAHYFNKHEVVHPALKDIADSNMETDQYRSLFSQFSDSSELNSAMNDQLEKISDLIRIRKNESKADLEAGFLCHLAGYNRLQAGERFLEEAYAFYTLDTAAGNYPSLFQRKRIIQKASMQLDSLIDIYEAGTFLQLFRRFDLAKKCYLRVLQDFQNVEVLNNLGTIEVINNMFNFDRMFSRARSLHLPLTVAYPEIGGPGGDYDLITPEMWKKFIRETIQLTSLAEIYFSKSLEINPEAYYPYLNLGINHFIQFEIMSRIIKDHPEFNDLTPNPIDYLYHSKSMTLKAQSALSLYDPTNQKALSDVIGMLGIIEYHLGDTLTSKILHDSALLLNPSNHWASKNRQILTGELEFNRWPADLYKSRSSCLEEERMKGSTLKEFILGLNGQWGSPQSLGRMKDYNDQNIDLTLRSYNGDTYKIYEVEHSLYGVKNRAEVLIVSKKGFEGSTGCGGLSIGDEIRDLKEYYGDNPYISETSKGSFWYYSCHTEHMESEANCEIGLNINSQGKISDIILYDRFAHYK